jgi:hypothetical protein
MKYEHIWLTASFVLALSLAGNAVAGPPIPQLPGKFIDTSWNADTSGKTWKAHTSQEFKAALASSQPGDSIVLDAAVTYEGNFELPAKTNRDHKWIYIVSSALSKLPPPGTRVSPDDAANMPKIVTTNVTGAIKTAAGANYYRLVGLEITSTSTLGCKLANVPRINCWSYNLLYLDAPKEQTLPDSITVDRCYLHGSPTQDVGEAVFGNASNLAVVDSYISDIHRSTTDSQAILSMRTPGPIKIVNNYLSASTENVMFGGGGGYDNPYVPSDIEIKNNLFFKPLDWAAVGVTVSPKPQWTAKNLLEFKNAQRVLVESNIFENSWASGGQSGGAILFTVRTSQSGDLAVVNDITFTNNILKNVTSGFVTLSTDFMCGREPYTQCTKKGEARRIAIENNLILFRDPKVPGGARNIGVQMSPGMSDFVLQHNTFVPASGSDCWNSIYFAVPSGIGWPPAHSLNDNVWILDNVLCRPPTGDWGAHGTAGLEKYMGTPTPVGSRYAGNVMFMPGDAKASDFPPDNILTKTPIKAADSSDGRVSVTSFDKPKTTDGKAPGADMSRLRVVDSRSHGTLETSDHPVDQQGKLSNPK